MEVSAGAPVASALAEERGDTVAGTLEFSAGTLGDTPGVMLDLFGGVVLLGGVALRTGRCGAAADNRCLLRTSDSGSRPRDIETPKGALLASSNCL